MYKDWVTIGGQKENHSHSFLKPNRKLHACCVLEAVNKYKLDSQTWQKQAAKTIKLIIFSWY